MADASMGFVTDIVSGRIEIDVSQMRATRDVVVRAAQEMEKAMTVFGASTDQAADRAVGAWGRIGRAIRDNEQRIGGLALAVTGFGVSSARSVGRIQDQFRILVGDERRAAEWMNQIRQAADDTHQAFLPLLEGATSLVPIMRQGNAEFGDMLTLVQQLAGADPQQGARGATFALREFFSGTTRSLAQRFELSNTRLQNIFKENEDDMQGAIMALQDYLDELGYSTEALAEFGAQGHNSFAILRSEAQETAAVFFTPFNDGINQAASGLADLLGEVRDIDGELAGVIGTMTALVGLTQAASLAGMIPGLGAIPGLTGGLGLVGRAAGVGLAGYGGAQLGVFATRQLADAGLGGGFERFEGRSQQDVMGELQNTLKQAFGILIIGFSEGVKVFIDLAYGLEEPFNTVKDIITGLGDDLETLRGWIDSIVPDEFADKSAGRVIADATLGPLGGAMADAFIKSLQGDNFPADAPGMGTGSGRNAFLARTEFGGLSPSATPSPLAPPPPGAFVATSGGMIELLEQADQGLKQMGDTLTEEVSAADAAKQSVDEFTIGLLEMLGITDEARVSFGFMGDVLGKTQSLVDQYTASLQAQDTGPAFNEQQIAAFAEFQADMAEIEAEFQERRIEQEQQYEDRRLEMEQSYQDQLASVIENEGIRRERAEESLARSIAGVKERETDQLVDLEDAHQERLAELRDSYQEAEVQARKNLHDRLEDLEKSYRDRLLNAAANFDGWAIMQAQDAYREQQREAVDKYRDESEERRQQYEERLDEEQAAHEERMDAARDNAEEQIRNLQENFEYQERLRAQDYQRQLTQMEIAHQKEMASLATKYQQQQSQLDVAEARELSSREQAFRDQLVKLDTHNDNMLAIQQKGLDDMEQGLRAWFDAQADYFGTAVVTPTGETIITGRNPGGTTPYGAAGGPVRTGMMFAQSGEYLLNQQTTRAIQSMLGQDFNQPALVGALAGGGGGEMINIQFTQHITGGAGGIDQSMVDQIRDVTTDVFMEVMHTVRAKRGKIT